VLAPATLAHTLHKIISMRTFAAAVIAFATYVSAECRKNHPIFAISQRLNELGYGFVRLLSFPSNNLQPMLVLGTELAELATCVTGESI